MEDWKLITGYLYEYYVSNDGRIKNSFGKILTPIKDRYGYFRVRLTISDKKRKNIFVHRLVANYFIGHEDFSKMTVNHIDGNKLNNNLENLEIVTAGDNNKHAYKTGLKNNKGTNHGKCRFSEEDIFKIREMHSGGISQTVISKLFNTTQPRISEIVNWKSWQHLSR